MTKRATIQANEIAEKLGVSRQATDQAGLTGQEGILPRRRELAFPLPPWEYDLEAWKALETRLRNRHHSHMLLYGPHITATKELARIWQSAKESGFDYNESLLQEVLEKAEDLATGYKVSEAADIIAISRIYFYKLGLNEALPRQRNNHTQKSYLYYRAAVHLIAAAYQEIGSWPLGKSEVFSLAAQTIWDAARMAGYEYTQQTFEWLLSTGEQE